ncbi:MAG: efflux RND transporter periplasmic adaptor subunit [Pseudomonadota bacterium]
MTASAKQDGKLGWLIAAAIALALAFAVFFGAGQIAKARDAAKPPREAELPLVEVVAVRAVPQHHEIKEEGFLRPRAQIDVVPEVAGKVVDVAPQLQPGGRFATGERLFTIDPRTFEADLARAKAEVTSARAELTRAQAEDARQGRLQEAGASAISRREQARASLRAAEARMGQANAGLIAAQKAVDDTRVTAPFDAAVVSENVALGRFVQPGQAVATIFDTGAGEVVLGLLPEDARAVRRAVAATDGPLKAIVTPTKASAGAASLEGNVISFGQSVDARSRTVPVVIEVPGAFDPDADGSVYANDFVEVTLPAYSPERLYAVPTGVLRQERFVWTLTEDDRLSAIAVKQVASTRDETLFSASEDLSGRMVVVTALTNEEEGLEVEVLQTAEVRGETLQ